MEVLDKRRFDADGERASYEEPQEQYDEFKPTLDGVCVWPDHLLIRVLKLKEERMIASPDAYAEPTLFGEVMTSSGLGIVRFLKGVGTSVEFSDSPDQSYLTIHREDVICYWPK